MRIRSGCLSVVKERNNSSAPLSSYSFRLSEIPSRQKRLDRGPFLADEEARMQLAMNRCIDSSSGAAVGQCVALRAISQGHTICGLNREDRSYYGSAFNLHVQKGQLASERQRRS